MNKRIYIGILLSLWLISGQAQELLNYPLDTIHGEEVYRYQAEKGVGLYRIGVTFNVSQSEIIRLNPQLRERGLHYGEELLIPTGRKVGSKTPSVPLKGDEEAVSGQPSAVSIQQDTADSVAMDSVAMDSVAMDSIVDGRKVIELALMLPFESRQMKRSGNAERMMEVYQGALLALREMQNDSTIYRLHVYDTERSERIVKELCDSTELDSVQGILGPVYPIQIDRMAEWCEIHEVPLLLPFSDDIDLARYPHAMQFNSTDQQEADSLCAWMSKQDSVHYVAIEVREADITPSIRTLRKQMKSHGIPYTGLALRDLLNDSAAYAMDSVAENIIILHSDRYQHARMLLSHLVKLQEAGFRIRIISQYSWQKEEIGLPQVYTSMFVNDRDQTQYDSVWAESFKNEHVSNTPRYDLLGYDLMKALIGRIHGQMEIEGLQSTIRWTAIQNGGYQNACVQVVAY